MGFNKRKMEDQRQHLAEKEAKARRATEKQILEGADHLITVWNDRQAKRMPMLFSPTIGAPSPPAGHLDLTGFNDLAGVWKARGALDCWCGSHRPG